MLFKFENRFWVKTDNTAVPVVNVSCAADAFEFLFKLIWVLNVEYQHELRFVYGFLEKLMKMKPSVGKSVALAEFWDVVVVNP